MVQVQETCVETQLTMISSSGQKKTKPIKKSLFFLFSASLSIIDLDYDGDDDDGDWEAEAR